MKDIVKKLIAYSLTAALCAGAFTGCGEKGESTSEKSGNTIYGIGDTAEGDGVKVTFESITTGAGSGFLKPDAGNIFVYASFEIENVSDEDVAVSSLMCFDSYFDDTACSESLTAISGKEGLSSLDGTIAPGKKLSGAISYEVPENWKEFEVHMDIDLTKSDKLVFEANSEQVS